MHAKTLSTVVLGCSLCVGAHPATSDQNGRTLEVQGHRGGIGLRPENTLWAIQYALEIGVNVLEVDTVFTKDEVPVIWHDYYIYPEKCRDTEKDAKYVGQYVANLTLAQIKTLDCGSQQLDEFPQAELRPGARIPTLEEVIDLIECYNDPKVEINLETKLDPLSPNETLPLETYTTRLLPLLSRRHFTSRTYLQSLDWRILTAAKSISPHLRTVALLEPKTITPVLQQPQNSTTTAGYYPWLGGINLERDFGGDFVAAAASIGVCSFSPVHGEESGDNGGGYEAFVDKGMVERAHEFGMKVVPWTVDDEGVMDKLITDGVDGIISNYPETVMKVGRRRGVEVGLDRSLKKDWCLVNASGVVGFS